MDKICSPDEFQRLLQDIKSSDVVEVRVDLLTKLYHLNISENSDFDSLADFLVTLWEDFTCLDASQCMLNTAILDVAGKYIESGCLRQYLILGTMASIWCGKHLNATLTSPSDSQEHSNIYFQLLLKVMVFSVTGFSVMAKQAATVDLSLMGVFDKFVSNQLDLVNVLVSEIKRIHSFRAEILKGAQTVIDGITGACRAYWDACLSSSGHPADRDHAERVNSTIGVVRCAVEKLCQLGVIAASNGGSLVTILNMSWKAVVSLLHLGKGALAVHLAVSRIISSLLSLAKDSLLSAADTWLSPPPQNPLSSNDARRSLLPAKFYLLNAVRISLLHPLDLLPLRRDVADCLLTASAALLSLSSHPLLHGPAEALAEFLNPASFALLKSLLNSAEVETSLKLGVLDWFFPGDDGSPVAVAEDASPDGCEALALKLGASREKTLLLGRVGFFLNLLEHSRDLGDDSLLGLAEKLEWLLDTVVRLDVYSAALAVTVPIVYGSGESQEVEWRPLFNWILHSSKTFLVVAGLSHQAEDRIIGLLLGNLLNPHFLCRELVVDLLSFIIRHAGPETVHGIFNMLMASLVRFSSRPEIFVAQCSPLRVLAGSVGILMSYAPRTVVDRACCCIFDSEESLAVFSALVAEGLPLDSLSENVKGILKGNIGKEFALLAESWDMRGTVDGAQVLLLCTAVAASQCLGLGESGIGSTMVKNLIHIIQHCKDMAADGSTDLVVGKTLEVISKSGCIYRSADIGKVVFALEDFFTRGGDSGLFHSKTGLALFLSGLAQADLPEADTHPLMSAFEKLFHLMLRERHWAGAHLGVSSFGNFAARTTYDQLWRLVPKEAALSYDLEKGEGLREDGFVLELKSFLEKGTGVAEAGEEADLLSKEAGKLLEMGRRGGGGDKKRKLPEGVVEGLELMRNGVEMVSSRIDQWPSVRLDDGDRVGLLEQISRVRDVVDGFSDFVKGKML